MSDGIPYICDCLFVENYNFIIAYDLLVVQIIHSAVQFFYENSL